MNNMQIGKLIAELRKKNGLTQQQLADKLNLSNKTISKWESGLGAPDISNLTMLAATFNISVDELLKGELKNNNAEASKYDRDKKSKIEIAIIIFFASIGAILGILAYNFGWLG